MIFRREITLLCKFAGTVKIFLKMPSIRMRTTISPSCGSRWMSLARSKKARSMTEFTKRIVGAADALPASVWFICTGTISGVDVPTSRFISSMARAVPSLPYNVPMACSVARRVEIIGTTRLCEAALISSCATKFNGSLMATKSSSFTSFTGTTLYFFAMARGTNLASSNGIEIAVKSMKSTPSCICSASMSCRSVMILLSIRTSPRRSFFCF